MCTNPHAPSIALKPLPHARPTTYLHTNTQSDLVGAHSHVLNYATVRWLEKFHGRVVVHHGLLHQREHEFFKELFDLLEHEGSVKCEEIREAMTYLFRHNILRMTNEERSRILMRARALDRDGDGSLSFDEFVLLLSSDQDARTCFRLSDEKATLMARRCFFEFSMNFRRAMLLEQCLSPSHSSEKRLEIFQRLFQFEPDYSSGKKQLSDRRVPEIDRLRSRVAILALKGEALARSAPDGRAVRRSTTSSGPRARVLELGSTSSGPRARVHELGSTSLGPRARATDLGSVRSGQ